MPSPATAPQPPGCITPAYRYGVYGITVLSEIPLALPAHPEASLAQVEFVTASAKFFQRASAGAQFQSGADAWYHYAFLPDGSTYANWIGVGEFIVSPGGVRVTCRRFAEASHESFQVYLLGQALSFALVKHGFEPLHATVLAVEGRAIAFLGESGFGKSSMAACFLQAGHRILTDDLLITQESGADFLAYPGPPRVKLFPNMARRFLGGLNGAVPMNNATTKQILPLEPDRINARPIPLAAIYAIVSPDEVKRRSQPVAIEPLSPREAFLTLVRGTFNARLVRPERLERQFHAAARLSEAVPVRRLAYPRIMRRLPEVRDAVIADALG